MIFNNKEFALTIQLDENKEPMFDAEQVAKNLGITKTSMENGKEYTRVRWERVNRYLGLVPDVGQNSQDVAKGSLLREPQVYKLAFKASNELAERFTDWLANDVLPEIRRTGSYSMNAVLPQDYPSALRALAEEVEKKEQLLIENKQQADKIEKDKPLVEMAQALMDLGEEEGKTRPTEFTKSLEGVYGIGRNTFYEIFREMGIWNENNIPYARFVQAGYFLVREKPWYNKHSGVEGVTQIVWITPKGRKYLINRINKAFSEEA